MRLELKLKQIVGSRTRAKLIELFFSKPGETFYVRQVVRLVEEEINSVRRELANLEKTGVLLKEQKSNKLFYKANFKFVFFNELVLIGFKSKKFWADLTKYNNKENCILKVICSKNFVCGTFGDSENEVDMVIIGKINVDKIGKIVEEEEKNRNKEINYMVMTKKEFTLRIQSRDPLLIDIFLKEPITVLGGYV